MPDVVDRSVKLCPGQNYRPFLLRGEKIGVFGDKSSVIRSQGRGYAIIVEGTPTYVQNVMIRGTTEAGDANSSSVSILTAEEILAAQIMAEAYWCAGQKRPFLSLTSREVSPGSRRNTCAVSKLINNRLDDSSGWGSYNFAVEASDFLGNTWSRDNRACNTESGPFPTGCESAGWLCIACHQNIIAQNFCINSGDCFYMNGEFSLNSNNNRFHRNECRASPHNCYEVTFAIGNEFVENIARDDPDTGAACNYPFWVGGSHVIFARNTWSCRSVREISVEHATASTNTPTRIENR